MHQEMNPLAESARLPLSIALIGLDARQRNAIEMVFQGRCRNAYRLVEDASAQAWIIDIDDFHSNGIIQERLAGHAACPCLFLSVTAGKTAGGIDQLSLRKPFRMDDFVWMLEQLDKRARPPQSQIQAPDWQAPPAKEPPQPVQIERVSDKTETRTVAQHLGAVSQNIHIGTAPDINLSDPLQHKAIYYDPNQFFQGHLARAWQHAEKMNTPLKLQGPWPELWLDPAAGLIRSDADFHRLRPFASVPVAAADTGIHPLHGTPSPSTRQLPASSLIWKLSLWAARGRLPHGTPLDTPIYVRHWPNFTRLEVTPSALAITALWANKPHSLKDTVAILGIPQRHVFAYYSAANALQLAAPTSRAVDSLFAPEPLQKPPHRGMLQRFLDRLRS